jgi:PIN domain nuclease of toxin-antitoxin system
VKLLLDTHCLIWVLTDAPQLDASSRSVIANAEGVWFSEASIWELGLKWRKGKIAVQPRRLADQAFANGLRPLPIQMEPLLADARWRYVTAPATSVHMPARAHRYRVRG